MANNPQVPAPFNAQKISPMDTAQVHVTSDNQLRVQFNINELLRKIAPDAAESHCSGCLGCMGCKI